MTGLQRATRSLLTCGGVGRAQGVAVCPSIVATQRQPSSGPVSCVAMTGLAAKELHGSQAASGGWARNAQHLPAHGAHTQGHPFDYNLFSLS